MTPREAIRNAAAAMAECDVPDPLFDASQLLSFVTGRPALTLRLDSETELSDDDRHAFQTLCARREKREPLQYILGSVYFLSHRFLTDPRALIPRPETELLAEKVIGLVSSLPCTSVLDLCCGTGCIGISVSLACPACAVTLADLSSEALDLARENAAALGASVQFLQGDLFAPLQSSRFDLIVSNPPYIPDDDCQHLQAEVLREPVMALEGGKDGLDFYRRIAAEAPDHLNSRGHLLVECGDGESDAVARLFTDSGFQILSIDHDYQSLPRIVHAQLSH